MKKIYGKQVDSMGRCIHYNLEEDIIANQCFLCKKYYACYRCHNSCESHDFVAWPLARQPVDRIVLCGACHYEMSREEYQKSVQCPLCKHKFNLSCSKHKSVYFQIEDRK